ncbi:MAG TPA: preprotein translocase subunit SecE [Chitinophagales bacterium]|nr:preprotein translocase subunit SecE [Chitinophagales bacterium]
MNRFTLYIKEAYSELLNKVTWPTWEELQESAVVVLVASLIIALVVLGMDQLSNVVMKFIYKAIIG